jgi:hypothetical protein
MGTDRKTLTAPQADALRERVEALKWAIVDESAEAPARVAIAAMLYLVALIQEAEASSDDEREKALGQRRVALEKLSERLGSLPTAEDLEACVSPVVPFDRRPARLSAGGPGGGAGGITPGRQGPGEEGRRSS